MAKQTLRVVQNVKSLWPPYSRYAYCVMDVVPKWVKYLFKYISTDGFLAGVILFFYCKNNEAVVTVGHRISLSFSVFNFFCLNKKLHIVKELYVDETSIHNWFKTNIYRFFFKNVELIITNSSREIECMSCWLALPRDRFKFIPWPSNVEVTSSSIVSDYIFAAGRSFRDWDTFFQVMKKKINMKAVIVAEKEDLSGLDIPENVSVYTNLPHEDYINLLAKSLIVVVPLKQTFRSIGQAVILESMSFGKAIVCAKVNGSLDYIKNEVNGLFYEPYSAEDLEKKIDLILSNEKLRVMLENNSKNSILFNFNKRIYSRRIYETINYVYQKWYGES